ncbi:MAG: hypothetical protein ED859_10975 [Desulfuromonadales bacterium]|nr:MAG: hypothetical protein ED859_10975 [Desulfuromonadales bacterium]
MNGTSFFRIFLCGFLLLATSSLTESYGAESGDFRGSWIANGTRTPFPFGAGRQVFTFRIVGHVSLQAPLGKKKDFWSDCIGLADTTTGMTGRCVWKDLGGPEIYLTIQSSQMEQGNQVVGTLVGGTGPFAGISGDVTFNWTSVTTQIDADGVVTVNGQTKNIIGRYQKP